MEQWKNVCIHDVYFLARLAKLPTGLYILPSIISFFFSLPVSLMITRRQIISGSAGPIFAIFSPNESVLDADDWSGPLFGYFKRRCHFCEKGKEEVRGGEMEGMRSPTSSILLWPLPATRQGQHLPPSTTDDANQRNGSAPRKENHFKICMSLRVLELTD